jgi:S-adenosylmethionine:tRNA-ribosyltransferase-isomerase (queuine synthetase)
MRKIPAATKLFFAAAQWIQKAPTAGPHFTESIFEKLATKIYRESICYATWVQAHLSLCYQEHEMAGIY